MRFGRIAWAFVASAAIGCSEGGSVIGVDGGESDATESHDTVFVPQLDDDAGGDAPMVWIDDGGDGGDE